MGGRWYFLGHGGCVVLWDELCRRSVHGGWGGRRTNCRLVGCVVSLFSKPASTSHFSVCKSTSQRSFSSPVFWKALPHSGPAPPHPFCTSWPAVPALPLLLGLGGPAGVPGSRFGRGWARWVGCSRWSCCLKWEEGEPPLPGVRGRWTERALV